MMVHTGANGQLVFDDDRARVCVGDCTHACQRVVLLEHLRTRILQPAIIPLFIELVVHQLPLRYI